MKMINCKGRVKMSKKRKKVNKRQKLPALRETNEEVHSQSAQEMDFKEQLLEQFHRGEIPTLKRDEVFCFDCIQCGECCRNREDILLNPFDVFRLCRKLQMEVHEFFKKYCDLYIGHSSKFPIVRIEYRSTYGLNGQVTGTRCPFLGQKNGLYYCRVHDSKPFVCFSYPLGRVREPGEKEKYILQEDVSCNGAIKAQAQQIYQQVESWMGGKEKVDMEEQYSAIFEEFVLGVRKWINLDKLATYQKGNSKEYEVWTNIVGHLLYENYEFEKSDEDFIKQLKLNIEIIKKLCDKIVELSLDKVDLRPKKD